MSSHWIWSIAATGVVLLGSESSVSQQAPPRPPPNVVLLRTDDQDFRSMDERCPSGALVMQNVHDLIVAKGTSFSQSFVSCSLCCPSRVSVLTGQYASHHGNTENVPPYGGYAKLDHSNTLPVWLQSAGYRTAHFGKYLNGYGQEEAEPNQPATNPALPPGTTREVPPGWSRWFTSFLKAYDDYYVNDDGTIVHYGHDPSDYYTDVVARKAAEFVETAPPAQPFFLVVDFTAPHDGRPWPFDAKGTDTRPTTPAPAFPQPAPRHDGALDHFVRKLPPSFDEADVSGKPLLVRLKTPRLDARKLEETDRRYRKRLESLLAVDEAVKRIVDALAKSGRLGDTYVFFTSDNGYLQGEHRLTDAKLHPYEESIRVPLAVRGPDVPAGQVVDRLVCNVDLTPTIAAIAHVEPRLPQDGRSLLPLIADPKVAWRHDLLIEAPTWHFSAIRNEHVLYVEWDFDGDGVADERELYDLVSDSPDRPADPDEMDNRADRPDHAAAVKKLSRRLAVLRGGGG